MKTGPVVVPKSGVYEHVAPSLSQMPNDFGNYTRTATVFVQLAPSWLISRNPRNYS
jgi:hypothetical protein